MTPWTNTSTLSGGGELSVNSKGGSCSWEEGLSSSSAGFTFSRGLANWVWLIKEGLEGVSYL
nr:hypothetical protein [Candidatus Mycoplasma haematolamae]